MSVEEALFQRKLAKAEEIAGLSHALDLHYRQIRQAAHANWKYLFAGRDPADACVTVRVGATPSSATRGAGFLNSGIQPASKSAAKRLARFAH